MTLPRWTSVYIIYVIEYWAIGLIVFAIVWFFMRKTSGKTLEIGGWWYAGGVLTTMMGAAAIKFASIFVIGGKLVQDPPEHLKMFFLVVVPTIVAIAVGTYIKSHAYKTIGHPDQIQD